MVIVLTAGASGADPGVPYNGKLLRREKLTNPHFNSFDEINFDELLDISLLLNIIKALIWL